MPSLNLSERAFAALRTLITAETGIVLGEGKRNFVAARLSRRLRELGIASYDDYHLFAKADSDEIEHLVNAITTNKTSFFREGHHFDMMARELVPALVERARRTGIRRIRIWSAGCSSGEEPYSIAMTLHACLPDVERWDVRILASDIDTQMLARANAGVYTRHDLTTVPADLCQRYFEVAGDDAVRVKPELRRLVTFRHINLNASHWPLQGYFDAIFCRNVIIYFDQATQRTLFTRFAGVMHGDAVLVLGHSETLHWLPDLFRHARNTTYILKNGKRARNSVATVTAPASAPHHRPAPKPGLEAVQNARRITVGQVFATRRPTAVRTLLGSCVAACLYDPQARVGGMNHFLLPAGPNDEPTSARFGVHAMELLINAIMRQGGDRRRLEAKIFGGAHVIDIENAEVPAKNIAFIREFLTTEAIPVRAEMLGGAAPLDVCMFTDTGRVLARRLGKNVARTIAEAESKFMLRRPSAPEDGVLLF